jgi:hypothetical protein
MSTNNSSPGNSTAVAIVAVVSNTTSDSTASVASTSAAAFAASTPAAASAASTPAAASAASTPAVASAASTPATASAASPNEWSNISRCYVINAKQGKSPVWGVIKEVNPTAHNSNGVPYGGHPKDKN